MTKTIETSSRSNLPPFCGALKGWSTHQIQWLQVTHFISITVEAPVTPQPKIGPSPSLQRIIYCKPSSSLGMGWILKVSCIASCNAASYQRLAAFAQWGLGPAGRRGWQGLVCQSMWPLGWECRWEVNLLADLWRQWPVKSISDEFRVIKHESNSVYNYKYFFWKIDRW